MAVREGKYGPFYYCTAGKHGTISVEKYEKLVKVITPTGRISSYANIVTQTPREADPFSQIKLQTMQFQPTATELEEWIVDGDIDDPDNWQNLRPY